MSWVTAGNIIEFSREYINTYFLDSSLFHAVISKINLKMCIDKQTKPSGSLTKFIHLYKSAHEKQATKQIRKVILFTDIISILYEVKKLIIDRSSFETFFFVNDICHLITTSL